MAAPLAPVLVSPVSAALVDPASGVSFTWAFKDPDPGDTQSAYALRRTSSSATGYWNGTDFTNTTVQWNVTGSQSVTIPFGQWPMYMAGQRSNRLSDQNAQLESTGVGTWSVAVNSTLARDTSTFYQGVASLKMTSVAAGAFSAGHATSSSGYVTVVAGQKYSIRVFVRAGGTTRAVAIGIQYLTSAGAVISQDNSASFNATNAGWTEIQLTNSTAPATAARALLVIAVTTSAAGGEAFYWDVMGFYDGTAVPFLYETYVWSIATKDAAGNIGPFANDQLVTTTPVPSVTVTAPTGAQTAHRPVVNWVYSSQGGFLQEAYQVKIFDTGTASVGGFDPNTGASLWDSGIVVDPTAASVTVGVDITFGLTYRAWVRVRSVGGLWSAWAQGPTWTNPASSPGLNAFGPTPDAARGAVSINIGAASAAYYVVDRSLDGGATWEEVRWATRANPAPQGQPATTNTTFWDYDAPLRVPILYRGTSQTGTPPNTVRQGYWAYSVTTGIQANNWFIRRPDVLPADSYLVADGSSITAQVVTAPDTAGNSITGDIDIAFRANITGLSSTYNAIMSKNSGTNTNGWVIYFQPPGVMIFRIWFPTDVATSSGVYDTEGKNSWYRVTRIASTGVMTFYKAPDSSTYPTAWTQVGSPVTVFAGSNIIDGGNIVLGQGDSVGIPFQGKLYQAVIKSGIAGTTVASPNFQNLIVPGQWSTFTTHTDAQGNVFTSLNGSKVRRDPNYTDLSIMQANVSGSDSPGGQQQVIFYPEGQAQPVILASRQPAENHLSIDAWSLDKETFDAFSALIKSRATLCVLNVHGRRWYCRPVGNMTYEQIKSTDPTNRFPVRHHYNVKVDMLEVATP